MAAVATVESNRRKMRRAASPPFTDSHQSLRHFLIANLPIEIDVTSVLSIKIQFLIDKKTAFFYDFRALRDWPARHTTVLLATCH